MVYTTISFTSVNFTHCLCCNAFTQPLEARSSFVPFPSSIELVEFQAIADGLPRAIPLGFLNIVVESSFVAIVEHINSKDCSLSGSSKEMIFQFATGSANSWMFCPCLGRFRELEHLVPRLVALYCIF